MRGHLPASRATKRQRRRPENRPRHCRACRRAMPCSAKQARASKQASASCAPCLRSSAPDAASVSRSAIVSLARAFHTSPPSQNGTIAACHIRLHRTRHALETWIGQRLSHGPRRPACEGRSGPPRPNRLASACWAASEVGFSNGRLRPNAAHGIGRQARDFAPWSEAIKWIGYCLNHSARASNSGVMALTPLSLAPAKPR